MKDDHSSTRDASTTHTVSSPESEQPAFTWEADYPLLTNPMVLKQFYMLVLFSGLFMFLLLAFIMIVTGELSAVPSMFLLTLIGVGVLALLMLLVMLLYFGNRIRVRFTLDQEGAVIENIDIRAKIVNRAAAIFGTLGLKPGTAGAGVLAVAREIEQTPWTFLTKADYSPRHRTITLRNSWRPVQILICNPGNYKPVAAYVAKQIAEKGSASAAGEPVKSPLPRLFLRTLIVIMAMIPVFTLPYPFELDLFIPLLLMLLALATVWLAPLLGWVVIVLSSILVLQVILKGFVTMDSIFNPGVTYRHFELVDGVEWLQIILAFAGLAYLIIMSWRYVRGKDYAAIVKK
jgi:hypothetical protein